MHDPRLHDLRLVGVHEDGEHLVLVDAEGERHLLAVDDALRAAVRRDRPHLGQLQIEIEGGLRPRDVQARIRAGASAEEVAACAGWTVEKVRRYEGPVLAERAYVAGLAQDVRLRRRSGQVTLGSEVTRRLAGRGVDPARVRWDSWRVDGDPWTVVVEFTAGGRDRAARWQFDLATRSITPGDDEARWLSEDQPEGEGPLAGARLTSVPLDGLLAGATSGRADRHQVYDLEGDGGLDGPSPRSGRGRSNSEDPLDLMTAMRSRRQGRHGHRRPGAGSTQIGSAHPAGRQRPHVEPVDLDDTLMDDPPAAHPRLLADDPRDDELLRPAPHEGREADASTPEHVVGDRPAGDPAVDELSADRSHDENLVSGPGDSPSRHLVDLRSDDGPERDRRVTAGRAARATTDGDLSAAGHWPLADAMRHSTAPLLSIGTFGQDEDGASSPVEATDAADEAPADPPEESAEDAATGTTATGRHRGEGTTSRRSRRSSVPSWDDIMLGTRRD